MFKALKTVAGDMLYPDGIKCVVCGRDYPVQNRLCLCPRCTLPENAEHCLSCGRALSRGGVYCDDCQRHTHAFTAARAPLVYEDTARALLRRLKYGNGRYLAPFLASLMAETYLRWGVTAQAVTFVPMHKKRLTRRGYNQAELLARSVSELLNLPLISPLARTTFTKNLARMGREERETAVRDAIACTERLTVRSVLLVDDVFTTGATAAACAAVLKKHGAQQVYVLTAATGRGESI